MDKGTMRRQFYLVYSLVAAGSIVLALVAVNYFSGDIRMVSLSLSAELVGIVIVFFLVRRLFFVREIDLTERMEGLVGHMERKASVLRAPTENEDLASVLRDCSEVSLLGMSFSGVLRRSRGHLTELVRKGGKLRLMVVNPMSDACRLIMKNSRVRDTESNIRNALDYAREIAKRTQDERRGSFEVRLLDWIPSCGMILADPKKESGHVRVTIYPPYLPSPTSDRVHFVLVKNRDKKWYDLYVKQFEQLWGEASPWDPSSGPVF
jgi:hypothetical protein